MESIMQRQYTKLLPDNRKYLHEKYWKCSQLTWNSNGTIKKSSYPLGNMRLRGGQSTVTLISLI